MAMARTYEIIKISGLVQDRVKVDGRTDSTDRITFPANAVDD